MSKKLQITVSDDMFIWLSKEAEKRGTRVSTLVSILLGESRKRQIEKFDLQTMMSILSW